MRKTLIASAIAISPLLADDKAAKPAKTKPAAAQTEKK